MSASVLAQTATTGGVLGGGEFTHGVEQRIVFKAVVLDVGDVHRRLDREEEERAHDGDLFGRELHGTGGTAFVEGGQELLEHEHELEGFLVAAGAGLLAVAVEGLFDGLKVGEGEFGVDDVDVVKRIDLAGDVNDVVVGEATDDVGDGVALADVGEELVAEAFALAGAGDEAGDVDEFDGGRDDAFGMNDFGERLQARIGNFNDADVRFNGAERIVFGSNAGFGKRIEDRRLADVGKAYDATLQTHGESLLKSKKSCRQNRPENHSILASGIFLRLERGKKIEVVLGENAYVCIRK